MEEILLCFRDSNTQDAELLENVTNQQKYYPLLLLSNETGKIIIPLLPPNSPLPIRNGDKNESSAAMLHNNHASSNGGDGGETSDNDEDWEIYEASEEAPELENELTLVQHDSPRSINRHFADEQDRLELPSTSAGITTTTAGLDTILEDRVELLSDGNINTVEDEFNINGNSASVNHLNTSDNNYSELFDEPDHDEIDQFDIDQLEMEDQVVRDEAEVKERSYENDENWDPLVFKLSLLNRQGRHLTSQNAFDIIKNPSNTHLNIIPRGKKEDVAFLVQTNGCIQEEGNLFFDDRGAWCGHSEREHFFEIQSGKLKYLDSRKKHCADRVCDFCEHWTSEELPNCHLVNGGSAKSFFIQRSGKSGKIRTIMDPQPEVSSLIIVKRYYSVLERCRTYKRTFFWITQCPSIGFTAEQAELLKQRLLVCYEGGPIIAEPKPHRNGGVHTTRPFLRVHPSVNLEISKQLARNSAPNQVSWINYLYILQ
jgi:hypothetical protein